MAVPSGLHGVCYGVNPLMTYCIGQGFCNRFAACFVIVIFYHSPGFDSTAMDSWELIGAGY